MAPSGVAHPVRNSGAEAAGNDPGDTPGGSKRGRIVEDEREVRVAERPGRPLLVYDGDCGFCRGWVGRWRGITGDRVEYRPSQEVSGRFPEVGDEGFAARVWLIEPDGRANGGARA